MKRFLTAVLAIVFCFSMVQALETPEDDALDAANILHGLGLFSGTGTDAYGVPNYDLNRAPTRHEAVTMLVHLLGKDEEAMSTEWETPFTDVAEWAKPFVGYAYNNKLTSGVSETEYGGDNLVTAAQYLTFILKALGYETGTDFRWDRAWELSDRIGITQGQYNESTTEFLRGDLALISQSALSAEMKGEIGFRLFDSIFSKPSTESDPEEFSAIDPEPQMPAEVQPDPEPQLPTVRSELEPQPYRGTPSSTTSESSSTRETNGGGNYTLWGLPPEDPNGIQYVVNMNTHKFHYSHCSSVGRMSAKNRHDFVGNREDLIASGFEPCAICEP